MSFSETVFERARAKGARVVLPEGEERRVLDAAARLAGDDIARPLLIGGEAPGCETLDPEEDPRLPELVEVLRARRPKLNDGAARRMLTRPAYFAGALVAAGHAEAMVAGAATPTKRVIEAASLTVGPAEGVQTPSSFFAMVLPGRTLIFADCALNVAPSAEELADIAVASTRSAQVLLGEARTAFLSFSTLGSGAGSDVERVREALEVAKARAPDLDMGGEFQADTALNATIAAAKGAEGPVAGRANVLIFPSLEAGNIGYKLVQELAGAQAVGPILQGFAKPVADLSRGASVDDIVAVSAITVAMS